MSIIGISRCLIFKFVCLEKKIGIFPQVFFKFGFKSPMTLLADGSGAEELVKNLACMIHRMTKISILFTTVCERV